MQYTFNLRLGQKCILCLLLSTSTLFVNITITIFLSRNTDQGDVSNKNLSSSLITHYKFSQQLPENLRMLHELTTSGNSSNISCHPPLMFYHNRIVLLNESTQKNYIPRILHISERSRCIPRDMYHALKVWEDHFPSFSIFFHDDAAVDRLFYDMDWPEFPNLKRIMACVMKGAMKIDVWRVLILWKFGGLYSDADVLPSYLTDSTIHPNASFFSLSDSWARPSQWLFATSTKHRVCNDTMQLIMNNILKIRNIAKTRVVFVTGPQVLYYGWKNALIGSTDVTYLSDLPKDTDFLIFPDGSLSQKITQTKSNNKYLNDTYWRDEVSNCSPSKTVDCDHISRKERMQNDFGHIHWLKASFKGTITLPPMACQKYLELIKGNET